ncbi:hypothetical protein OAF27_01865 [Verrucomicrobiales bacterium]|nr:hypothetical protein [Verrucomicrobiales bacterium]
MKPLFLERRALFFSTFASFFAAGLISANAQIISFNFEGVDSTPDTPNLLDPSESAGLFPALNWNNLLGVEGEAEEIVDTAGAVTEVEVEWVGGALWSWERQAGRIVFGSPDGTMFNGYLDTANNNGSSTVSVFSVPYASYDVIVYIDGERDSGSRPMRVNVNPGGTGDNPALDVFKNDNANYNGTFIPAVATEVPGTPGANYAIFAGLTTESFEIFAEAETFRAAINGFQIVERLVDDTDGDGLLDVFEIQNMLDPNDNGVDPDENGMINPENGAAGDPDMDGADNLREQADRTNPQDNDTDDDLLLDGVETGTTVFVDASNTGTDPLSADSDEDGLADALETNTRILVDAEFDTGTDPNDPDTDDDGLLDGWEVSNMLDPFDNGDTDVVNGASGDPDMDLLDNLAEQALGTDPQDGDTDDDTLLDGVETDTGIFVGATNTGTSPFVNDTDSDRILDADEVNAAIFTDPNLFDSDNDGLTDPDELNLGTDPSNPDSDNDTVTDGMEVAFASDPNDGTEQPDLTLPSFGINFEGLDARGSEEDPDLPNLLDPGDVAGFYPIMNWNNGEGTDGFAIDISDSDGNIIATELDWDNQGLWSKERIAQPVPDTPDGTLFNGYLDTSGTDGITELFLIEVPYPIYHVIVYVDGAFVAPVGGGGRAGSVRLEQTGEEFFIGDTVNFDGDYTLGLGTADANTRNANIVVFSDVTSPGIEIVATARNFRVAVNAIQIVESSNPIPVLPEGPLVISDVAFDPVVPSVTLTWPATAGIEYTIERSLDLTDGSFEAVGATTPDVTGEAVFVVPAEEIPADATTLFFRLSVGG